MSASSPKRPSTLSGKMAHWSAEHRKTAIFGWLGFVVFAVLVGGSIGQKSISNVDRFSGESHSAEQALDSAGLRPNSEVVFFQSETLTVDDPEFFKELGLGLGRRCAPGARAASLQPALQCRQM